ncbi:MAG: ubiquinone biosynthesis protein UbiJ [Lentisphaeria bacterium]
MNTEAHSESVMSSTALAALVEKAINSVLRYDPGTRHELTALQNHTIAVCCETPSLQLYFTVIGEHIIVAGHGEYTPSATIRGELIGFASALLSPSHSFTHSSMEVSGSSTVLAKFQSIFRNLDIDWEEPVEEMLNTLGGDTILKGLAPTHLIANALKDSMRWGREIENNARHSLAEFLQEELRAVPTPIEVKSFCENVDEIHADINRAAARMEHLSQKTPSHNAHGAEPIEQAYNDRPPTSTHPKNRSPSV